jgi:uncharacterized membrane protein YqjE
MLRRLLESRLAGARRLASEVIDGADDRSKLLALEFAVEKQRLTRLVLVGLGALVVSVLAVVWAAATLVAFTWDTEWRHATLLALLAFWLALAVGLCLKARRLIQARDDAFRLSREVAAEDFNRLREALR